MLFQLAPSARRARAELAPSSLLEVVFERLFRGYSGRGRSSENVLEGARRARAEPPLSSRRACSVLWRSAAGPGPAELAEPHFHPTSTRGDTQLSHTPHYDDDDDDDAHCQVSAAWGGEGEGGSSRE